MQTCNFLSVGNRTYILSYSHFRKLHVCTLFFLYLVFGSKIREIDHIVIPSKVVCLRPYPLFLKNRQVPPHPFHTMIQQVRQSFFAASAQYRLCELQLPASQKCLHVAETCTLIFVSAGKGGGCRVCHVHLSQLRGPRWRLDGFCFYLSQRRVCFLDLKEQEKLETQIRASTVQDSRRGCCLW